jgi:hypothetical protein
MIEAMDMTTAHSVFPQQPVGLENAGREWSVVT